MHIGEDVRVYDDATEEGRVAAVAEAEPADEAAVRDEAAPALADKRGVGERGRLRRKMEEYLGEQVVVFQRRRHRRAGVAAEAAHLALTCGLWWSQTRSSNAM
jgi:hypothetical protein